MNGLLTKEQVEDLLLNVIGVTYMAHWKGDQCQFTCPIHGDTRASMGVHINFHSKNERGEEKLETSQVVNCFSCGFKGTLEWLLFNALPDEFKSLYEAIRFINKRYDVDLSSSNVDTSDLHLKRYDDLQVIKKRFELPMTDIAPFKSGKETYGYFYDRGFDKNVVKEFKIGRDLVNKTVTVPIFWQDGKLCGVIGRYIDPNRAHNERFKIYNFPKSGTLYPLDKFVPSETGEVILVEGLFDAIRMHDLGYHNTLTTLTDSMSTAQKKMLLDLSDTFIDVYDNDLLGRKGAEVITNSLKREKAVVKSVVFPENGKDPCEWSDEDIHTMMDSSKRLAIKLKRK